MSCLRVFSFFLKPILLVLVVIVLFSGALYIDGNNISGGIPDTLSNLLNLRAVGLGNTGLEVDGFPEVLLSLTELQQIRLENLAISGPLSSDINNLVDLRLLYLEGNAMSGELPDMSALVQLGRLRLEGSSFEGDISFISSLVSLTQARLGGNSFSGEIPDDIGSLQDLEELELQGNPIEGAIPDSITTLKSLSKSASTGLLQVHGAHFSNLCSMFLALFNFALFSGILDVSNCPLTGVIPEQIGDMESLGK